MSIEFVRQLMGRGLGSFSYDAVYRTVWWERG